MIINGRCDSCGSESVTTGCPNWQCSPNSNGSIPIPTHTPALNWEIPHNGGCQGTQVMGALGGGYRCKNKQCSYRGGDGGMTDLTPIDTLNLRPHGICQRCGGDGSEPENPTPEYTMTVTSSAGPDLAEAVHNYVVAKESHDEGGAGRAYWEMITISNRIRDQP